jgi:hypothetical protein
MILRKTFFGCIILSIMAVSLCTKVEYTNPIDSRGTAFTFGDSAAMDDNGDGIANYYDPSSQWYKNHYNEIFKPSTPTLTLKLGDTVIAAHNDPNRVLSNLGATAMDSVYGDLTSLIVWTGSVYTSKCTTYAIIYSVTNPAHTTASKTQTIIIDCAAPEITLNGDNPMSLAVGAVYSEPGATAIDNIDGTLTSKIIITGTVSTAQEHTDTVTYTVSDRAGNKTTEKRAVTIYKPLVKDTIPPVIVLRGSMDTSVKVGNSFVDPGYTASDNIDGNVTANIIVSGSVNTAAVGTYTLTYTVSDKAGNNAVPQTRIVRVLKQGGGPDVTPPVITLKPRIAGRDPTAPDTVKVGSGPYIDPGFVAIDDVDGNVSANVAITELYGKTLPINTSAAGAYTLKYTVSDKAGNTASVTRDVFVVGVSNDKTAPVINLTPPLKDSVGEGRRYVDPGYSATDDVDGNISAKVQRAFKNSSGAAVDSNNFFTAMGQYSITYTVSDMAGNQATPQSRTITVFDTTRDTSSLRAKYGLPLSAALPSISMAYKATPTVDGKGGPIVSNVTTFTFNWDAGSKQVNQFAFNTNDGRPSYYVNFTPTQTFAQASPGFTLSGSGIAGLDGSYYIKADATQCVWLKTDGSFAIIFKP